MTNPTSIQINHHECKCYEATICDEKNCIEKECKKGIIIPEQSITIETTVNQKAVATFLLAEPIPMTYETWKFLHKLKGD